MALKIRLTRLGSKGEPFYRVVVAEDRSPRDGKFIQILGTYDPKGKDASAIKIDKEKATEWLGKGAQPTETARVLFKKAGIPVPESKAKTSTPKPRPETKKKEKK